MASGHHHHSHHHHHDHDHHDSHFHVHGAVKNLKIAFLLNLTFTIIELVGGLLTNSMAILSDAIHDLGDTLAIGSALFFEQKSGKKRDNKFSYGYRRLSTLAALLNVIILTAGSIIIAVETIPRLMNPQPVHAGGMIGLAILGVLMNGLAVWRLSRDKDSVNQRTVMLHLMEDSLGWAAVLLGSIVIYFTGWIIIDPILSMGIALYILYNALKHLRGILNIFLQAVPSKLNLEEVKKHILQLDEVEEVHDMHVWTLDGEFHVGSLHLVVPMDMPINRAEGVKKEVRQLFADAGIQHVTIEVEGLDEDCEMENCLE
ncbi:cation transporter [bacterium SCSIO 12741]|nr:cation transporter [bacterium SCSIO 12741]